MSTLFVFGASIAAGGICAMAPMGLRPHGLRGALLAALLFALGGALGFLTSPIVLRVLHDRAVGWGAFLIYGSTAATGLLGPQFGVAPALLAEGVSWTATYLVDKFLPRRKWPEYERSGCSYDLRGCAGRVCPECGTPKARTQQ